MASFTNFAYAVLLAVFIQNSSLVYAADNQGPAVRWTKFAKSLHALHEQRIETADYTTSESVGGYGGMKADPAFYTEVKYLDRKSGRMLANVKKENRAPNLLHVIELYIYDDHGRLIREYTAAYLPGRRETPYQTLINIYAYGDGLQAFRQFDASDDLLYEQCLGEFEGQAVRIAWDDLDMPEKAGDIGDAFLRKAYKACFQSLPNTAGTYLSPLNELK